LVTPEFNPLQKRAKDISAGAVLILAIAAAAAGLIFIYPQNFKFAHLKHYN
jgi:diacylglycerol kinase